MDRRNAEHFQLRSWAGRNQGFFQSDLPEIAEWDRLLRQLGLNDLQALEAVKADGEAGESLRKFVWRAFRHFFVPEVVIEAVRHRTVHQLILPIVDPSAAASSTAAAQ
jgi:hypothetical protein